MFFSIQIFSWPTPPAPAANLSVTARPPIACAPATPVPTPIEDLPAAPDLNLPDPDVLVNQLGMLVTAAEGENMRTDPLPSNQSKDPTICLYFFLHYRSAPSIHNNTC